MVCDDRRRDLQHCGAITLQERACSRWIMLFFLIVITCFSYAQAIYAYVPPPDPSAGGGAPGSVFTTNGQITNTAMIYCTTQINSYPGQIIYPFVQCLTEYPDGFIPATTIAFMNSPAIVNFFLPAVSAMAAVLVMVFGIKLMLGDVQNLKGDAFTLLFKIGGVLYFLTNAVPLYGDILTIMATFNNTVGTLIQTAAPNAFCSSATNTLWQDFDCIFEFILGVGAVVAIAGIVIVILLLIFTAGTGIVIVIAILHLLATFFFSILRFIQVYVMAVMALSFIYVMGFLFVPLLFFKDTFRYFQRWLAYIMGYVLIPLLMYTYMGMLFVIIQVTIFTGPNSIFYEVFGAKPNASGQLTMPNGTDTVDPTKPDSNPFGNVQCAKNCTPSSPNDTNCPNKYCTTQNYSVAHAGVESHSQAVPTDVGVGGNMNYNGQTAHQFNSSGHSTMVDLPIGFNLLDLTAMAYDQGDNKSVKQYLIDICISVVVAALLAYIMFSLMGYIPELASSLVSSGTHAGSQVTKAAVFGEAAVIRTLEIAQDVASAGAGRAATEAEAAEGAEGAEGAEAAGDKAEAGEGGDTPGGGNKGEAKLDESTGEGANKEAEKGEGAAEGDAEKAADRVDAPSEGDKNTQEANRNDATEKASGEEDKAHDAADKAEHREESDDKKTDESKDESKGESFDNAREAGKEDGAGGAAASAAASDNKVAATAGGAVGSAEKAVGDAAEKAEMTQAGGQAATAGPDAPPAEQASSTPVQQSQVSQEASTQQAASQSNASSAQQAAQAAADTAQGSGGSEEGGAGE